MSSSTSSSSSSVKTLADTDPVTRNALRYTISAREYDLLYQYLIARAPALKKRAPAPSNNEVSAKGTDDYNAATIRLTLRLFLATYTGLAAWDFILEKVLKRAVQAKQKVSLLKTPTFRLSLSLSSILFFHRVLFRFFHRLRESLRTDDAKPFRRRNPRIAKILTSKLAPAVGASLGAGFFLGVSPADQTRITVAIYTFSRSLEFFYNSLEERGWFKSKPWWVGSWLLMPLASGQLLHAFVFDRDCFPESYGSFILKRSPEYIQQRPAGYPAHIPWPATFDIVDSLASISKSKWPTFISPILFPNGKSLSKNLTKIAPITDPAHPAIKHLSCAVLHPNDPSCLRTFVNYYITAFPPMAKFFTLIYALFALPRYRAFANAPLASVNKLAAQVLRTSVFLTSAIGTAWGSICMLQHILPGHTLPTSRWFLSGFLAGMWALCERTTGRSSFLYSARMSLDSLWKVGKKHGWWRGIKNGDVLLFVMSLMLINVVYERDPKAVSGGVIRKSLGLFRGDGWVDRAASVEAKGKANDEKDEKKTA